MWEISVRQQFRELPREAGCTGGAQLLIKTRPQCDALRNILSMVAVGPV